MIYGFFLPLGKWGVPQFSEGIPQFGQIFPSRSRRVTRRHVIMVAYSGLEKYRMEIGGRRVLMNEVIFVPDGEVATFVCPVAVDDTMPVRLEFPMDPVDESTPEEKRPEARFSLEYEGQPDSTKVDCLILKFFNFDKSLGQSLTGMVEVAVTDGKEIIYFFASVQKLARVRKIEFQFMLGAANS